MKIAVMPGSFDPFTLGHENILKRACKLFDFVCVGVLINKSKNCIFTDDERVDMINKIIDSNNIQNAKAESFHGMLVDFVKEKSACAVIRGIRSLDDFTNEMRMADLNSKLCADVDTVCLYATPELAAVSSSAVREIANFGGDISKLVPPIIYNEINERIVRK